MDEQERCAREFVAALEEMNRQVEGDTRLVYCSFRGDPQAGVPNDNDTEDEKAYKKKLHNRNWKPRIWNGYEFIDDHSNIYMTVSAMYANEAGEFRRKKENFAAGLGLMIDDLGSGIGAKHPLSLIEHFPPTAFLESSLRNFQAFYMFDKPVTDALLFDRLIQGFITKQFLGVDSGMAGINRVFRLPFGINGKPKHDIDGKPWRVKIHSWRPDRRFTVRQIANAFRVPLKLKKMRGDYVPPLESEKAERHELYSVTMAVIIKAGMVPDIGASSLAVKSLLDAIDDFDVIKTRKMAHNLMKILDATADREGWIQVRCPWINGGTVKGEDVQGHSGGTDDGAAIRMPMPGAPPKFPTEKGGNDEWGGFRCHHSHGSGEGERNTLHWRDVVHFANNTLEGSGYIRRYTMMNEEIEDIVNTKTFIINDTAPEEFDDAWLEDGSHD